MATFTYNANRAREMAMIKAKDRQGMSGPHMKVFPLQGGGLHVEHHGFHAAVPLPGRRTATLRQHQGPAGLTASHTFANADEFKSHLQDVFGDHFVHTPQGAHFAVHVPQFGTTNSEPVQEEE